MDVQPSVSGAATRKFPLTATTYVLQDQFIPVLPPSLKMEHYNSHGEIVHRPPAYVYLSPYPYPFPLVYPSPRPLPSTLQPGEPQSRRQIRLCARAPECTTVLPSPYPKDLCKRCLNSTAPPPTSQSSSSAPTPSISTPASSRSTPPAIPNINTTITSADHQTTHSLPPPIIGKKRAKPGPRSRTQGKFIPAVPEPYTTAPLAAKRVPRPIPLPPPSSHRFIPPATSRIATTTTAPRPCTTPACTNSIPAGSSTVTQHCPACVRADWDARKIGIRKWLDPARRRFGVAAVGESELGQRREDKGEGEGGSQELGRRRSESGSSSQSLQSLFSLSSLTSLDEDGGLGGMGGAKLDDGGASQPPPPPAPPPAPTPKPAPIPTPRPKLTLRFHSTLFQNAKSFRFCCDPACSRKLEGGYTRVRCVPCRARARQRRRDLFEELTALRGRRRREVGDGGGRADEGGDGEQDAVSGARLCAARSCTHVIPPWREYKSHMCLSCRCRGGGSRARDWGGSAVEGGPARRCASLDCGMVVIGVGSLCVQCAKRKAWEIQRVERVRQGNNLKAQDSDTACPLNSPIPTVPPALYTNRKQTMYPEYDCLASLAANFKTQLYAFFRDQVTLAMRQNTSSSITTSPTTTPTSDTPVAAAAPPSRPLFTFSGQFSTVSSTPTSNFTHPTHSKPIVLRHIASVRTELERVSHLRLHPQNPREPVVVFKQGFAMRFACVHSIPLELFVSVRGSGLLEESAVEEDNNKSSEEAMKGIKKDIKGELDVIAVVDESHCVLPGQMTVVRFRMGVVDVV